MVIQKVRQLNSTVVCSTAGAANNQSQSLLSAEAACGSLTDTEQLVCTDQGEYSVTKLKAGATEVNTPLIKPVVTPLEKLNSTVTLLQGLP